MLNCVVVSRANSPVGVDSPLALPVRSDIEAQPLRRRGAQMMDILANTHAIVALCHNLQASASWKAEHFWDGYSKAPFANKHMATILQVLSSTGENFHSGGFSSRRQVTCLRQKFQDGLPTLNCHGRKKTAKNQPLAVTFTNSNLLKQGCANRYSTRTEALATVSSHAKCHQSFRNGQRVSGVLSLDRCCFPRCQEISY